MPTSSKRIAPAKRWCFTLNNWTENEYGSLVQRFSESTKNISWIIGKETGSQGTNHLQGYISSTIKFRPLPEFGIKRDGKPAGPHFEKAKGTQEQNIKYCSKEGDFKTNIKKEKPTQSIDDQIKYLEKRIKYFLDEINEIGKWMSFDGTESDDDLYLELTRHWRTEATAAFQKKEALLLRMER